MVKNYTSRTRKHMVVIAYDITDDKRRNRMVKLLEQYGSRINYEQNQLLLAAADIIDPKCDQVAVYHVCADCYAKTEYLPRHQKKPTAVVIT